MSDQNVESRLAAVEEAIGKLKTGGSAFRTITPTTSHNPLFGRGAGRNIIEIAFDDSIDASNALECFFQMPTRTRAVHAAKVWVQRKSFRTYNSASTSAGSPHFHPIGSNTNQSTSSESAHTHGNSGTTGNQGATHTHDASSAETQNHTHVYSTSTGAGSSHGHIYTLANGNTQNEGAFGHTHTITLTSGIFETAASGTVSLFVANDGTNYGSAIVSAQTVITGQTLLSQLTSSSGDKRIKITATGLMRVQVLLFLDLDVAVIA